MQVYFDSPLPSLFSFLGLVMIYLVSLIRMPLLTSNLFKWSTRRPIDLIVTYFVFLVLFQTCWQTIFCFISVDKGVSVIVIFILPVLYYIYFRNTLKEKELRSIFISMAIAGLIVGAYFAYDSLSKLLFGILPDYAVKANEYSLRRGGGNISGYIARIDLAGRSMGLLEKHVVSSAWISIGCFAALALLPTNAKYRRILILSIYGILLVLGMNFTGIFGFLLAIFIIEFRGYYLFRAVISRRSISAFVKYLLIFTSLLLIVSFFFGTELMKIIQKFIGIQYDIAVGTKAVYKHQLGYFGGMLSELISFPANMFRKFPPGILIGDGFSPGWNGTVDKGGDYGFIETLYRLGIPLFLMAFIGLFRLIRQSFKQITYLTITEKGNPNSIRFAASVMIFLLFSEIHYTVWSAKPIFPVFFICLALFSRYLPYSARNISQGE